MGWFNDKDYHASLYYKKGNALIITQDFRTAGLAQDWAKEEVKKNKSCYAIVYQGFNNWLSRYRWVGKEVKFSRMF